MKLDWADIGIHAAIAAGGAVFTGLAFNSGLAVGGPVGIGVCVGSGLLQICNVVGWPVREWKQHGTLWASTQSRLEWIVPSCLAMAVYRAVLFSPWS